MKFLLIAVNAKYIHTNPGVYSLRAYAGEEHRKHIEIAEYTINNYTKDILADIYLKKPTAIGFSCYIWNWGLIKELLLDLPRVLPGVPIWLGGPEVTYDAPAILKEYPRLTGIMVGEGEGTFRELMDHYRTGGTEESLAAIPGLCLQTGYTAEREPLNMDSLPFLYEGVEPEVFANRIPYYESSRGCPYRCSYCLSSRSGHPVRLRNIDTVKKELQFFLDMRVRQVKFVDRTFNCVQEHAMAIWQYLYEQDNGITNFHFEIAAEVMGEEQLALLQKMRKGLIQLEIGVQSLNPNTLKGVNRFSQPEKLKKTVEDIYSGGNIHLHLDLIAGLPYEDYESFQESFNWVYERRPHQLQLGFLKVLKGSKMYEKAEEYGICYSALPPYEVLYTKWLTYQDILKLKGVEEMVEIYYNSSQFRHTLSHLLHAFISPFAMYEALSDFWKREGYSEKNPARQYRYQILLHFAGEQDGENIEMYKELLLYDMYLREKLKARPDFAPTIHQEGFGRDWIRKFYIEEEKTRKWLPDYAGYNAKQLQKMTHMEFFHYPVWREEGMMAEAGIDTYTGIDTGTGGYILFDYRKRNPLTGDGTGILFTEEQEYML